MNAASKHKKLRIHTGTHFHPFHAEEGRMDQLRWFDYWLKGIDTGIMDEPPVKLEIRTGGSTGALRVPLRERMAARAHAVDQDVSARPSASRRAIRCDVEGELVQAAPPKDGQAHLLRPAASPRPAWRRARRCATTHGNIGRTGVSFETAPMQAGHRSHRTDRAQAVGVEHVRRHGHLRDHPQHRSRRQGRLRGRPARPAGAVRDQGLAARVAPQARSRSARCRTGRITRTTSGCG